MHIDPWKVTSIRSIQLPSVGKQWRGIFRFFLDLGGFGRRQSERRYPQRFFQVEMFGGEPIVVELEGRRRRT
jgi:hypothetical protein